ncbi:MAG TPA: hypothetical protein ENF57_04305 [Candidatus Korarchaeota archaeon]|nr:hypothetical protein [Candidatus Korarchaeota archaeon]
MIIIASRRIRLCPSCGKPLRRGKARCSTELGSYNTKWFCDNPNCDVIFVVYDELWLKPIRIAREAKKKEGEE